jgi:outer membrane protein
MKRFAAILLLSAIICFEGISQKLWTLEDCIGYALENNISLKRRELQSENARQNYNQSRISVLPSIGAGASHYINSGRALNTDTYQWENREFEQGNLGIQSQVNLFSGLQEYNNIRQQRYLLLSTLEEVERAMNDISLRIANAFFQILLDMELVEIYTSQLETSSLELESARVNFELGNASRGKVLEIESQVATNEFQLTHARNNLSTSYLTLAQMMQLDPGQDFQIHRPEKLDIDEAAIINNVDYIYGEAENILPQFRIAEYYLKSRERALAVSRGMQSPRLSMSALFYSRYSEGARNPMTGVSEGYTYSDQIRDNQYRQLGISLYIPIFSGWSVRNRIGASKISVLDAQYQLDETRQILYSEIHLMHNNAISAFNRFNSASKAVDAAEEAFGYAQQQFRLGLINFVDFQLAQSNLFRAQSNMAQAKYEYYLRSMILDFYLGEPLGLN